MQDTFGEVFNEGSEFQRDGPQFARFFKDGNTYDIGGLTAFAIDTPGHTPACMVHVIGEAACAGDTFFMPDGGPARDESPGGDAGVLYDSIQDGVGASRRHAALYVSRLWTNQARHLF